MNPARRTSKRVTWRSCCRKVASLAFICVFTPISALHAADADEWFCRNGSFARSERDTLGLAEVQPGADLALLGDMEGCPNESEACRIRGAIVAGSDVITGRAHGRYVCVYQSNNQGGSAGWALTSQLTAKSFAKNPPLSAWKGMWAHFDNRIRLTVNNNALAVVGKAFWPSANARIKELPGSPHSGSFSGSGVPDQNRLTISSEGCEATLTLLGHYLLASDNGMCGGANVRFDGSYQRSLGH